MAKKVIIDCDPGIDDAVALCVALLEPELEVLAVTATEGNAAGDQSTRNVQYVIESLDPPRFPRIGTAMEGASGHVENLTRFYGADGLAGCGPQGLMLHQEHPSDKLICDIVRSAPAEVTVITLGPLTNLARAFRRDPELPQLIGGLVIMAGSVDGVGNVTPAAEFNVHYDPESARDVLSSPTTKTLVPLNMTRRIVFNFDMINHLPPKATRIGDLLHRMLAYNFRTHRQVLGLEGIHLHDVIATMIAIHPEWAETQEMSGDVETRGELTLGATVFDRRGNRRTRSNMEVVTDMNDAAIHDAILRAVRRVGQR